ncbi:hypothetical protein RHGRI_000323 [Rhododendron griersonianum]|uniref:Uncharacterized protein n=1 Tax=Rhododendron griersonianum TaxID=479676 RepID=A0AAV6LG63_9ERIC|nr:hypothetical protein RHGRI_000323 [Rhododendron griersonianum]
MDWMCELIFAWREASGCAHNLAKLGLYELDRGEQVFDQAPSIVLEALLSDRDGLGVHQATASSVA